MEVLRKETYIKMVENAVGSRMFNSILVKENDEIRDLLNDGEYSCAVFVSSVLTLQQLLAKPRTTVKNLEADIAESTHFTEVPNGNVQPGDILFWESVTYEDGTANRHVGIAVSHTEAVSTNYIQKCVTRHPLQTEVENTGALRQIERLFRPIFS